MSARLRWALLALACAAQLGLPLHYIVRGQQVLAEGQAYRVATAPIDPYDPFRGRYVQLGFRDWPRGFNPEDRTWYVPIAAGDDGYARFGPPATEAPASGDYIRVRPDSFSGAWLRPPFDRWYLEESLAPRAEQAYRQLARRRQPADGATPEPVRAELAIRVLDGEAVPEMLYLDGQPIRDYLATPR